MDINERLKILCEEKNMSRDDIGKKPGLLRYDETGWSDSGKNAQTLPRFRRLLGRTNATDQKLLSAIAQKMVHGKRPKRNAA
jgi:hypothetical protein